MFLTGSYAYGTPRDDSDIDIFCLCYHETPTIEALKKVADSWREVEGAGWDFRVGRLNLLVFGNIEQYCKWSQVTEQLVLRKPVTRDQAIAAFRDAGFPAVSGDM